MLAFLVAKKTNICTFKDIQEYSSSIKVALNHYQAVFENSNTPITKDQLDPNSPMEEKFLEAAKDRVISKKH